MIPLVWFLGLWLLAITIFCVMALLTSVLVIRYGVASYSTYLFVGVFLGVVALVVISSATILLSSDWPQGLDLRTLFQITDFAPLLPGSAIP